jgi:guanylate kinase
MTIGTALLFSGPSGVGKSTVCGLLMKKCPSLQFSVSCTTRAPRPGEIDDKDYHFLAIDEFIRRKEAGEFLECAEVHGNWYGTLRSEVTPRIQNGQDILLDIDVQGMRQARAVLQNDTLLAASLLTVFIAPPSRAELERRLRGRGTETEESIQRRLANSMQELQAWREYDYVVINDVAETAADELFAILAAARCRTSVTPKLEAEK